MGVPALFAESVPAELQRFRADRKVIQPLIRRIRWEAEHPDALSAHVQDALLAQFFWHLVRALPPDAVSEAFLDLSSRKAFPTQLMRVFRSNISRSLGLGEMARLMGISESSLSHKCKLMLGVSPARAFLRCRLEWARQLLRNTSMMVKEVAFAAGIQDPYVFSRAFARHFKCAPSDCRLPSP